MSKQITLSKIKQLIDINENLVNFDINFKITTKNNEPFDMVIVDQNTLNNNPNLEYKKVNGSISGNIKNNNNIFQTHFLVIKADNPCECLIILDKKEIMPELKPELAQPNAEETSFVKKYFSYILFGVVICVAIWYFFFRKQKTGDGICDILDGCQDDFEVFKPKSEAVSQERNVENRLVLPKVESMKSTQPIQLSQLTQSTQLAQPVQSTQSTQPVQSRTALKKPEYMESKANLNSNNSSNQNIPRNYFKPKVSLPTPSINKPSNQILTLPKILEKPNVSLPTPSKSQNPLLQKLQSIPV